MKADKDRELLARSREGLKQGSQRIKNQLLLIDDLHRHGRDTAIPEEVLRNLQECQELQKRHVELLKREIDRQPLEAKLLEDSRAKVADSRRLLSGKAPPPPTQSK